MMSFFPSKVFQRGAIPGRIEVLFMILISQLKRDGILALAGAGMREELHNFLSKDGEA